VIVIEIEDRQDFVAEAGAYRKAVGSWVMGAFSRDLNWKVNAMADSVWRGSRPFVAVKSQGSMPDSGAIQQDAVAEPVSGPASASHAPSP
jgi:hypothetical protein